MLHSYVAKNKYKKVQTSLQTVVTYKNIYSSWRLNYDIILKYDMDIK